VTTSRIARLQDQIPQDVTLLVTELTNVRYLSGFTGSNGALLVTRDDSLFVTDGRYQDQIQSEVSTPYAIHRSLLAGVAKELLTRTVWVEAAHMSIGEFHLLEKLCSGRKVQISSLTIESFRLIKDDIEIAALAKACLISTDALHQLINKQLVGRTERDIARELDNLMLDAGAEAVGFDTIVASGPNSAIPHHTPTSRILEVGDLLKIDFGARVLGYHADCTRTFIAGPPTDWQRETHEFVYASQTAASAMIADGISMSSVDQCARAVFEQAGRVLEFTHGLGHGVGLQIHEDPFLSSTESTRLVENMVVTVEPGLYVLDRGGVRIEDTIVVTATGSRNLTVFPYELLDIS